MRVGRDFKNGFVRISIKENEPVIGKGQTLDSYEHLIYYIVEDLIKWGVILKKKWHTIDKSRWSSTAEFKIKDEWYKNGISLLAESKIEPKFHKRLIDHRTRKKKEQQKIDKKFNPLIALFKDIGIRKKDALEWLDERVDKHDLKLGAKRTKTEGIKERMLDESIKTYWEEMVHRFDEFYLKVDIERGRVYSNAVNIPKHLRQFLYFKSDPEKKLVELDIKNSQPLLLSLVSLRWYEENNLTYENDLIRYKRECEKGQFYETMKNLLISAGLKIHPTFKTDFFAQVLFNDDVNGRIYQMRRVFDKNYPSVGKCISSIKRTKGYKEVSAKLTKIESELIIERVGSRLIDKGVMFFPLHDAIFTTEESSGTALKAIKEEFAKYGVSPKVEARKVTPVIIK